MSLGELSRSEVKFNLRRACKDCPFRKSTPCHEGVASDLQNLHGQIEKGGFLHSCHKTDPRSDGYVQGYDGPVSHCAGSLMMLKNMGPNFIQGSMLFREVRRYMKQLKPDPDIFPSFLAMVEHYVPFVKSKVNDLVECPMCEGDKVIYFVEGDATSECPECTGSGEVTIEQSRRFK